ncbi:MAG: alpha/beta hydrolase [Acidobacteriota bacterium]
MTTQSIHVVNGLLVRRSGPPNAPKLLCLHGFGDSGSMFQPLTETSLVDEHELVMVDLPGFGASPPRPGLSGIDDYGALVAELAAAIAPREPVGLIGHSIASPIAVAAIGQLEPAPFGIFSIEGNLTEDDAYFTGQAADWDGAEPFKASFLDKIGEMSRTNDDLRRYYGLVTTADASVLWHLGRDARRASRGDALGHAYRALDVPHLYFWSEATTPERTRDFLTTHAIPNRRYAAASHWPTVVDPTASADAIRDFFADSIPR